MSHFNENENTVGVFLCNCLSETPSRRKIEWDRQKTAKTTTLLTVKWHASWQNSEGREKRRGRDGETEREHIKIQRARVFFLLSLDVRILEGYKKMTGEGVKDTDGVLDVL